jgi:hypothetical protein
MRVQRLKIADQALLSTLAAFLATVPAPRPPYAERGDWRRDVTGGPPSVDRPRPLTYRRHPVATQRPTMPGGVAISAINYYPAGGSGLGWHTDSLNPGWRVYVAHPLTEVAGEFMTADEIIADEPGVALAFRVGAPESWHAVRTEGPRLSLGIRVRGRATLEALGLT